MSLAVLEINDVALTIRSENGEIYSEPGFARLTSQGIETGELARASAWLQPQSNFNQYWQQLGENPLLVKSRWARHFADIAFVQLKQLLAAVGDVERCVLAVSGSFSNQQLSLLLGMLNALSVKTLSVVDNALAARLHNGAPCVYLDLHLHQGVVTALDLKQGKLAVVKQETIPQIGIARVYNQLARSIANQLIETTRFDPLHDPAAEQWIFDQLPGWLMQMRWQNQLNLEMKTPAGQQPFRLRKADVIAQMEGSFSNLGNFFQNHAALPVVLSHTGSVLAELSPTFESAHVLEQNTIVDNCLNYLLPTISTQDSLQRMTAVRVEQRVDSGDDAESVALYVVHNHRALPLSEPVSIGLSGGDFSLAKGVDVKAVATVVQSGSKLRLLNRSGDVKIQLPVSARPGEFIEIEGKRLQLIEVDSG